MPPPRPFRFATGSFAAASAAEYVEGARRAEGLGYAVWLTGDHLEPWFFEPGPALTAAAAATTTIRVGCCVFANDFRHPALLAKEAATIDVLTGGRFEFGIGAGWHKQEYERSGIPFDPPAVRVARMEEGLTVVRGLWADGAFSFAGTYYTITELDGAPKPLQRPHPPIFVGGGGKRLLSFAAREADIVGIHAKALPGGGIDEASATEAELAERVGWVRAAAGARFDRIELALLVTSVAVADDRQAAAERLAGQRERIVEDLLAQREQHGISYVTVYPQDMEAFAPVVARLAGR
jgi:probable F420-dependent oxidoreductase